MAQDELKAYPLIDVPERIETLTGHRPSVATVRDWTRGKKLDSFKIGGRYFVSSIALDQFLENGKEDR